MKKQRFLCVDLLNTFSEKELKGLKEVVSCRYFNPDKYIISLLNALKKYVLGRADFTPQLQVKVYRQVFTDLPTSQETLEKKQRSHLNVKMSTLLRLAERFLVIENINKKELQKNELLYNILLGRRQISLFERRIKGDKQSLDEQKKIDENYHYRKYSIEKEQLNYLHQTGKLIAKDNLPEVVCELDMYYLINKLSLYNTALSLQYASSKKQYNREELKLGIAPLLKHPKYAKHPIAQLFYACITLLEANDTKTYLRLLALLDKHTESVPTHLLKTFYATANVHCAGQIRLGYLEYNKKMFDLQKIMHEKNLFIEDNFIQLGQIKNMVTMACRVEEYDWARKVLEYYREFMRKEVRESVYSFNLGVIAFYEKDYETAHSKFIQVDKVNTVYDINTRLLILKCLYQKETEYHEYTMQAFRSAERFFSNHQSITPKSKRGYKNFIQILIALYRTRHNINAKPEDIERIKDKLNDQKINSDKRWLMEKIAEM